MNKGICFHFGYIYKDIEEQVKAIKDAGFDCVIANADKKFECENGPIKQQIKLFKKYGLKLSSLHMRYNRDELPNFWKDNEIGKRLERNLKKDIKLAHKYGFTCVVVHLVGEPNTIGYNRLKKLLKYCEKYKVPLALENLRDCNCLKSTFENVKSEYLKFCYDAGHNHAFDPEIDYLSIYGDKLVALHLSDNFGPNPTEQQLKGLVFKRRSVDMHTLNKYGNIDWGNLAKKLSKIDYPLNLDYEVIMVYRKNETANEVLKEVYKQSCELEKLIMKHKKKK